jgi:hypothetical protein
VKKRKGKRERERETDEVRESGKGIERVRERRGWTEIQLEERERKSERGKRVEG